jgi:hypothetical protein
VHRNSPFAKPDLSIDSVSDEAPGRVAIRVPKHALDHKAQTSDDFDPALMLKTSRLRPSSARKVHINEPKTGILATYLTVGEPSF